MATARPPGGQGETPQATIGVDLSQLRAAPRAAGEAARATTREISNAFRALQAEQRIALEQQRQATAAVRAQQAQITATTRAESSVRMTAARSEAQAQQQAARAAAATQIEEQRRITAQFRSELRTREAEQRAALARSAGTGGAGGVARGVAGAALGSLGGPVGAIAGAAAGGAVPAAIGLAAVEGGRFAVNASQIATAYDRQRVAAINLAGSQQRLNELMSAYERAAGGTVAQTESLANVTKLMSVGFGDNAQEIEQFTRAIRGISIAMGTSQDTVTQNLILELFSQRGARLDQLGLQYEKVCQRADELRSADRSLTEQQAYQIAVLEQAEQRFGTLADSVEGQRTGLEKAGDAWQNVRLEIGKLAQGPVNAAGIIIAGMLQHQIDLTRAWEKGIKDVGVALGILLRQMPEFPASLSARTSIGASAREAPRRIERQFTPEQEALAINRFNALNQVSRGESQAIADVTRATSEQRASIIRQYEVSSAREAEDFARQRLNAERKLNMSILDVAQDSARQRVRWEAETERTINEARADRDERIAEAREDSAERVADIEERFNRDREKRQRAFVERLRDAAANMNAVEVRELQRQQREENEEAARAHEEAVADERESLQERIDEANKAFAKQEADQRAALQRRIDQQAEDDRLRIEQMKAAFEEQRAQEDIERGIRLDRQAADHAVQLTELETQAVARIAQIKDHAQKERDQIEEEFQAGMVEEEARWSARFRAYEARQLQLEKMAIDSVNRVYGQLIPGPFNPLQGPSGIPFVNRDVAPYVPPVPPVTNNQSNNTRTSTVNVQPGAITIVTPPTFGPNEQSRDWLYGVLDEFFEDLSQ